MSLGGELKKSISFSFNFLSPFCTKKLGQVEEATNAHRTVSASASPLALHYSTKYSHASQTCNIQQTPHGTIPVFTLTTPDPDYPHGLGSSTWILSRIIHMDFFQVTQVWKIKMDLFLILSIFLNNVENREPQTDCGFLSNKSLGLLWD